MASIKKERKEEEEGAELPASLPKLRLSEAQRMSETSEGPARNDVELRPLTNERERHLYSLSMSNKSKCHKPDRYAALLFRNLVEYEDYCGWIGKVNYVGLQARDALPVNLRKMMKVLLEYRFSKLRRSDWRKIREAVNVLLRVKRKKSFFLP